MMVLWYAGVALAGPVPSASCTLETAKPLASRGRYKLRGDMVNLRAQPHTSAAVLAQLPLASTVQLAGCVKHERIGRNEGCWYKVDEVVGRGADARYETAYLFFTAIATCYIAGDFDDDGTVEEAFLSQTGDEEYQVRLSDPNARVSVTWVTEEAFSNNTTLSSVDKSEAGHPLISLSTSPEACDYMGYGHYYLYVGTGTPTLHKAVTGLTASGEGGYITTTFDWRDDGTVVLNEDQTESSSSQRLCLQGHRYEPCGKKSVVRKVSSGHGL